MIIGNAWVLIAAVVAGVFAPAPTIIIRHDLDDSRFLAMGERYSDVLAEVVLADRSGRPPRVVGVGTVIAPTWVLTAAHVVERMVPPTPGDPVEPGSAMRIRGTDYPVLRVILHPSYNDEMPDAALVELARPISGGRFAVPYARADEVGKQVTFVGTGLTGTGLTGPQRGERKLRGATNRVDSTTADVVAFDFTHPDSAGATEFEGISGPGDSGGPALLEQDGTLYVLGISSYQDSRQGPEGLYGVIEYYTRVSSLNGWIGRTLATGK